MYNEELEQLIDAALTDGVLTEKEKQILFKKAQAMGYDLDEFEMVLDARLVKLQKDEAEKVASSAPKSNKLGDVKKCPACGAMVQSYQGTCTECGYTFEDVAANESVKKLSELLNKAKAERKAKIIRTFPIPSSKANFIELIGFLQASISNEKKSSKRKAFEAKLQECIMKAEFMFPNDAHLQSLIQNVHKTNKKQKRRENISRAIKTALGVLLIVTGLIVGYFIWTTDWKVFWRVLITLFIASIFLSPGTLIIVEEYKDDNYDIYDN